MKNKFKLFLDKLKRSMFGKESTLDLKQILNPPSWRERQIQNQLSDKEYEESLQAIDPHWSARYDIGFENIKTEVVRVRES